MMFTMTMQMKCLAADNVPIDNPAAIDSNPVSTAATVAGSAPCNISVALSAVLLQQK